MSREEERRIVVTGANKGIGRATVERILAEHPGTFVYLGSRDEARGVAALRELLQIEPAWENRLQVLQIDVSDDDSVQAASKRVRKPLYGLVNNAGIGGRDASLERVVEVNAYGPRRVCEAFANQLEPQGRVVIVTSAAGPNFVNQCSAEIQQFLLKDDLTWEELDSFMQNCLKLDSPEEFEEHGLGNKNAYGLSKACANAYMRIFARHHPELVVSACTPGFIATDLTKDRALSQGKSPEEMGMKTPHEGATAILHSLFGDLAVSGWYYGSDAQRSPMHRYRSPGDPPYSGED